MSSFYHTQGQHRVWYVPRGKQNRGTIKTRTLRKPKHAEPAAQTMPLQEIRSSFAPLHSQEWLCY
jgi:hypothetical protein